MSDLPIDLTKTRGIPAAQAAKFFPGTRAGTRRHPSWVVRMILDGWPDDVGTLDVIPPVLLLREQAEAISKQTGGLVTGQIHSVSREGKLYLISLPSGPFGASAATVAARTRPPVPAAGNSSSVSPNSKPGSPT